MSGERFVGDINKGGKTLVYVPPRWSISFKPSEIFDVSVNENNFKIAKNVKKKREARRKKKRTVDDISETVVAMLNKAEERKRKDG